MRKKRNIYLDEVLVESYAAEGKSLARRDGKVVFIENAVPGDIVDVKLSKNKKDWAEGYPVHFHLYSDERVQPFCQHFGICGGCQWQMLPYKKQLEYKRQQVIDNLSRIGKIALPEVELAIGCVEDKFYRNKLEFTFGTKEYVPKQKFDELTKDGNMPSFDSGGALGFHAKGFFDKIVSIEKCWLQGEPNNNLRNSIREFVKKHSFTFYDFREHKGLMRNLQLRVCTTSEVMVNVVFGEDDPEKRNMLLRYINDSFPELTTLLYTINKKMNDSLHDQEPVVYSGKGYVIEKLEDFHFKIGPKSFFQTNTEQAEKLYQVTRDFAELDGNQIVYDLYCGTGSIGIFCSKKARKIIGIELIEEAISDARENAKLNKIDHAVFFTGNVTDVCTDEFVLSQGHPDVIITDPPRAGMHEKLVHKILELQPSIIVYVSCNPATQARDLSILNEKYEVTRVQPVDMFPHTHHIENVVQLKKRR